jgi:hypothetical protein
MFLLIEGITEGAFLQETRLRAKFCKKAILLGVPTGRLFFYRVDDLFSQRLLDTHESQGELLLITFRISADYGCPCKFWPQPARTSWT